MWQSRRLAVVVDVPVAKSDELTISYIDTQQPLAARQKLLRTHYHFECACVRCVAEAAPGGTGARLSYTYVSGGGPRKAPASKREKREKREQKVARPRGSDGGGGGGGGGGGEDSAPLSHVRVLVDVSVLLKLAKAPSKEATRRRKGQGPPPPIRVPTCCVRLRLSSAL